VSVEFSEAKSTDCCSAGERMVTLSERVLRRGPLYERADERPTNPSLLVLYRKLATLTPGAGCCFGVYVRGLLQQCNAISHLPWVISQHPLLSGLSSQLVNPAVVHWDLVDGASPQLMRFG